VREILQKLLIRTKTSQDLSMCRRLVRKGLSR
jgi:hypothetical protein